MDKANIEKRRMELLTRLYTEAHPLTILDDLEQSQVAAFLINDKVGLAIRQGLADPRRRLNESSALAKVKIAAQTPDGTGLVYVIESFRFENVGTVDWVLSVERKQLQAGEIEIHSHVFTSPDYLGQVDVGDLIAAVEGPAWIPPQTQEMNPARRIFGILSVYANHLATLQFYIHDLRDYLSLWNNYGLKRLGMPISLPDAY